MVQYAALAWSREHPQLLRFTDNMRILDGLRDAGLIPAEDVALLQDAYKAYRARRGLGKVDPDSEHDGDEENAGDAALPAES